MDLNSYDIIIMPIHTPDHWTVCINLRAENNIVYYNSNGTANISIASILSWFIDYKTQISTQPKCTLFDSKNSPQQQNGNDSTTNN